jgi:hypothetical protein
LADHGAASVIEEKGEGFENGKKLMMACGVAFNLEPHYSLVRLTSH